MNYGQLKARIAQWLNRTDLGDMLGSFVELAEARIARDVRSGALIKSVALTVAAGESTATLPTDYVEGQGLSDQSGYIYATPEKMAGLIAAGNSAGYFSIFGRALQLGSASTDGATFRLIYYSKPAALINDADTNTLMDSNPGVYLYGALAEAGIFLDDEKRVVLFEAKYRKETSDAQWASFGANFFGAELSAGVNVA